MKFSFRPITCIWTISNWRRNNANNFRKTEDFLENEEPDRRNIEYKKSTFFFLFDNVYSGASWEWCFLENFYNGPILYNFLQGKYFRHLIQRNNSATFFWSSFPRTRRDHKNLKICCVFLDMKKKQRLKTFAHWCYKFMMISVTKSSMIGWIWFYNTLSVKIILYTNGMMSLKAIKQLWR